MDLHRNIQKSLLTGIMIAIASYITYRSIEISLANFIAITIFVFTASLVVDLTYDMVRKRRER